MSFPKLSNPLLYNNLYKLSIFILLHFIVFSNVGLKNGKIKKIKPPTNYDFESNNQRYDFTKICRDMQRSLAWKQLNLRQQGLYLHLKSKFTVNSKTLENNQNNISIPTSEAKTLYGDNRTFIKDIDTLIELGFIKQITSGVPTMSINIYDMCYLTHDKN